MFCSEILTVRSRDIRLSQSQDLRHNKSMLRKLEMNITILKQVSFWSTINMAKLNICGSSCLREDLRLFLGSNMYVCPSILCGKVCEDFGIVVAPGDNARMWCYLLPGRLPKNRQTHSVVEGEAEDLHLPLWSFRNMILRSSQIL